MKETFINTLRLFFEYHFLLVVFIWLLSYWEGMKNKKRLKQIEKHLGIETDTKKN